MHDKIYWVCAEVLALAVQLPVAANLPPAAELRQRLITTLDGIVSKGRAAGIPDAELAEARYALTAFLDEQILKSSWPGRAEWMNQPLQLLLYREYTAGENFFARLRALLQRGTPSPALQIYYLCMVLGFRGQYGISGDIGSLSSFSEHARQQLGRALPAPAKLGPNAQPKDRARAVTTSNALVYALAIGCLLVAILVIGGLSWALSSSVDSALASMPEAAAQPEHARGAPE
jgi:type VI secretion system protein ImpK